MKNKKEELIASGIERISDTEYENFKNRYLEILKEGNLEYKKDLKTNSYKKDERRLLNRLEKYVDNHLLFLKKFYVPFSNNRAEADLRFSNNRAEADLRFAKIRQKIGKFRSIEGANNFVVIRSFKQFWHKNR